MVFNYAVCSIKCMFIAENDEQDLEYLSETRLPILKLDVTVPNSAFQNENVLYKEVNSFITGMYDALDKNGVPVNGSQREVMMFTGPEDDIKIQLKESDTDGNIKMHHNWQTLRQFEYNLMCIIPYKNANPPYDKTCKRQNSRFYTRQVLESYVYSSKSIVYTFIKI